MNVKFDNVEVNHAKGSDTIAIDICYPMYGDSPIQHVFVDQMSVRASDGIRMHYDYKRDGWSIEQASKFQWDGDDIECDPDWQEVAFIESWAREEKVEE